MKRERTKRVRAEMPLPDPDTATAALENSVHEEEEAPLTDDESTRSQTKKRHAADDAKHHANTITVNGIKCAVESHNGPLRIIPGELFGPFVLLFDEKRQRLLLPNGIDGSVRVVPKRKYATVRLSGGSAELVSAGAFEKDLRVVARPSPKQAVSAAYRVASANFYDSIPTLAQHLHQHQQQASPDQPLKAEKNISSHPAAASEALFTRFHHAFTEYRRSESLSGSAQREELERRWAEAAGGRTSKRVTPFSLFMGDHAGVSIPQCRAAFRNLSEEQREEYERLANHLNISASQVKQDQVPASSSSSSAVASDEEQPSSATSFDDRCAPPQRQPRRRRTAAVPPSQQTRPKISPFAALAASQQSQSQQQHLLGQYHI